MGGGKREAILLAWRMSQAQADKAKVGSSKPLPQQGTPPGKVMAGLRREPTRGMPLDAVRASGGSPKVLGPTGSQ